MEREAGGEGQIACVADVRANLRARAGLGHACPMYCAPSITEEHDRGNGDEGGRGCATLSLQYGGYSGPLHKPDSSEMTNKPRRLSVLT